MLSRKPPPDSPATSRETVVRILARLLALRRRPEVGLDPPRAAVHEEDLVRVRISKGVGHWVGDAHEMQGEVFVLEERDAPAQIIAAVAALDAG